MSMKIAVVIGALAGAGVLLAPAVVQAGQPAEPHAGSGHEGPAGHDHDATTSHSFDDVERWVEVFDDPERDSWQRPDEVIEFLEIDAGDVVADLGAGTGYFSVRLARVVGDGGRVLAVDIESSLVDHIRGRAEGESLSQIVPVLAEPDDPKLPEGQVDLVLVVDTWHHINDRIRYLDRLSSALKGGGRLAIVDFHEGELPVGPPPGHKLSRDAVVAELTEASWRLAAESEELPYQYLLVFVPPGGAEE
jgi:ubiquinone/menaquinone biosynthesis C-methylase UbiE